MTVVPILLVTLQINVACPNLSGVYEVAGEDGAVTVTIAQQACDRVEIEWFIRNYDGSSRTRHILQPDGVFRADPAWVEGSNPHVTSARFIDERLELVAKAGAHETTILWRWAFAALPTRDLCTTLITQSNSPWPPPVASLAVRIDSTADATHRRTEVGSGAECTWPRPNEEF